VSIVMKPRPHPPLSVQSRERFSFGAQSLEIFFLSALLPPGSCLFFPCNYCAQAVRGISPLIGGKFTPSSFFGCQKCPSPPPPHPCCPPFQKVFTGLTLVWQFLSFSLSHEVFLLSPRDLFLLAVKCPSHRVYSMAVFLFRYQTLLESPLFFFPYGEVWRFLLSPPSF